MALLKDRIVWIINFIEQFKVLSLSKEVVSLALSDTISLNTGSKMLYLYFANKQFVAVHASISIGYFDISEKSYSYNSLCYLI